MKPHIAFWTALIIGNVWAASANPASTYLAGAWWVFAVLVFAAEELRDRAKIKGGE